MHALALCLILPHVARSSISLRNSSRASLKRFKRVLVVCTLDAVSAVDAMALGADEDGKHRA